MKRKGTQQGSLANRRVWQSVWFLAVFYVISCGRFNMQPSWFLLFRGITRSISVLRSLAHSKAFWMHWLSSAPEIGKGFNDGCHKVWRYCCPCSVQSLQVLDPVKWSAQSWQEETESRNSHFSIRSKMRRSCPAGDRRRKTWQAGGGGKDSNRRLKRRVGGGRLRSVSFNVTRWRRRKRLRKTPQMTKGTCQMNTLTKTMRAFLSMQSMPVS